MSEKARLEEEIKQACTLRGEFLLRSGTTSTVYFDKYLFETNPVLLDQVCTEMMPLVGTPDFFAGLEMGGIPLAVVLGIQFNIPTLFVRKTAKNYGTAKLAEGQDFEGKRLTVLEDVVTTGGQVLLSCKELEERGAIIDRVCCVILRNTNGADNIRAKYNFNPLFDFSKEV